MRHLLRLVTTVVALFCLGIGHAAARPFTFEDMIKLQTPGELTVSPDGTRLALSLNARDLETNSGWSKVMVLEIENGRRTIVSAGGEHESSPAWSPDGKRLAFVSDKSGKGQVWTVAPEDPYAATQITQLATGASSPVYSQDGDFIYFTSRVNPLCQNDACNKQWLEERAENPVKASVFKRLMYRHWDHWRDGRVAHIHRVGVDGEGAVDLMNGEDWGVTGDWDVGNDGWAYYTTKNPLNETLSTNNDIYRFNVGDAAAGKANFSPYTTNKAFDATPAVSPDGTRVAWHSHERPGFESDLLVLTVSATGEQADAKRLTKALDRPVYEFGWFRSGDRIWFAVSDRGSVSLYTIGDQGGEPKRIVERTFLTDITLSPDGATFYAVKHSLTAAPEVVRISAQDGTILPLTNFNDEFLEGVDLAEVEDFWWEGADGDKVHGYLLYPPGTRDKKHNKFLLLIHGGPQGAWGDRMHPRWNAQLFAAPGYVTLLANPRGSTGYGQEFTDQISRDWGGRVYEDLMSGITALVKKEIIDVHKMCAAGGSYGGYMVNWILGHSDKFNCLISHAGVYDLRSKYGSTDELWFPEWEFGGPPWDSDDYDKWNPSNFVENFHTPTLVIHGQHDYRVAVNQAMQLFTALQRQGVPSEFLYYPDETHFVVKPKNSQLWYDTIHRWMATWIESRR